MELRGNITTRLKQCIAYADDILLTTRTKQTLLDTFQKLKEILAQYGLIVNGQKTKYLAVRIWPAQGCLVEVGPVLVFHFSPIPYMAIVCWLAIIGEGKVRGLPLWVFLVGWGIGVWDSCLCFRQVIIWVLLAWPAIQRERERERDCTPISSWGLRRCQGMSVR